MDAAGRWRPRGWAHHDQELGACSKDGSTCISGVVSRGLPYRVEDGLVESEGKNGGSNDAPPRWYGLLRFVLGRTVCLELTSETSCAA